ncbi:peptide transporter [Prauserella sp. PE36]|uniref:ParA family protein n=1 Tax=Prauserella sp. PE36 TaxID=1504709 RepID=UPI000DE2A2BD|nr:ParA family protein [Prauserella sp. PE36]RBM18096.1 peptide transporter [Prauserella sp. PE36]
MARVHVVANQKGGVGKTTVTVSVAAVVADTMGGTPDETSVLGVSTDPQASMLEWAKRVGDKLPFDFEQCSDNPEILSKLRRIRKYSHIFVDTPGSLDKEEILKAVLQQADDVIVPIEPEVLAFTPAARTIQKVIGPAGVPFRVLINNWDPRDGESDLRQTQEFVQRKGFPLFNTVVRHYKLHTRAPAEGTTVVEYPKNRVALEARQDFFRLALEILGSNGEGPKHAGGNGVTTEAGED